MSRNVALAWRVEVCAECYTLIYVVRQGQGCGPRPCVQWPILWECRAACPEVSPGLVTVKCNANAIVQCVPGICTPEGQGEALRGILSAYIQPVLNIRHSLALCEYCKTRVAEASLCACEKRNETPVDSRA